MDDDDFPIEENEEDLAAMREIEREYGRMDKPTAARQLIYDDDELGDDVLSFFDKPQASAFAPPDANKTSTHDDILTLDLTKKRDREEIDLALAELIPEPKKSRSELLYRGSKGKYSNLPIQGKDSIYSTDSRGRRVFIELEDENAPPSIQVASGPSRIINLSALRERARKEEEYEFFKRSQLERDSASAKEQQQADSVDTFTSSKPRSSLWVDKYSPKSFFELLSEEKVNRNVLSWLKDWDGIVFNKEVKPSALSQRYNNSQMRRGGGWNRPPLNPTLTSLVSPDKKMRDGPAVKTILISGNPGIGKTTLAKIIARHCGYEPIEFNASDDRGASTFLPKVLDVVENASVFEERSNTNGGSSKPRCLIIDEIDGVVGGEARGAIKGLIDLIDGDAKASRKGPAKQKQDDANEAENADESESPAAADGASAAPASPSKKKSQVKRLKRPIICICNDPWVPALRPLRDRAVVFRLEPPSLTSLLSRLQSVCKAEGVRVDAGFLQALAELTNRDIRACLNTLQFLSSKSKILTPDMLGSAAIGSKDLQTSVFDLWRSIFVKEQKSAFLQHVLQQSARREAALQENGAPGSYLPPVEQQAAAANPSAREQQLFASVAQADVDRVLEGCWENYPSVRYSDPLLNRTSKAADWMEAVSVFWQEMRAHQMFGLAAYLPAAAVAFHQNCSVSYIAKPLQPPRLEMSFRPRREHHETVLKSFRSGISPELVPYSGPSVVRLDLLPMLLRIAVPNVRPLAPALLDGEEKKRLETLVSIYVRYGLRFEEGPSRDDDPHLFHLKPPIHDLGRYEGDASIGGQMDQSSDVQRQQLAQRIDVAKTNLLAGNTSIWDAGEIHHGPSVTVSTTSNTSRTAAIPTKLSVKAETSAAPAIVEKDFFGRPIVRKPPASNNGAGADADSKPLSKSGGSATSAGVYFKFQEGFTNAVRRKVYTKDLL
eukprot:TRINITY_DN13779_c0_g1_i1.p1 TRINITY_DN13779_c0_g1~~TRINITY_DN13779_c0_g1_i1.p1  ORF type:complete len:958 (-),score=203.79 TRINITY_DN13779_c0_g1_i1:36-2873(-)